MRSLLATLVLALTASVAQAADPPVLTSIDFTTLTPSGRFMVRGSNLDQAGQIHLNGVPATVWPIPGTNQVAMCGYVAETMPYGPATLTVTTSAGTSNGLAVHVEPRKPQGRHLWRFLMNNQLMLWRPALGSDGTIYARSQAGDVTAISPDGARLWSLQLTADLTPQIDIGADDTIYTADDETIYAIRPDGTVKWTYTDPTPNQGIVAGPNVGPDGNIYAVSHVPGLGIFSLDPSGAFRWSGPDTLLYSPWGQLGQEIVFSDTQLHFCVDDIVECFDFAGNRVFQDFTVTQSFGNCPQPAVGPSGDSYVEEWGQLRAYSPSGNLKWKAFGVGGSTLRDPDVGADGTVYVQRNVFNTLWAVNPDGSTKWTYNHPYTVLNPAVAPNDELLVIGGKGTGLSEPSFFLAMDTDGTPLWSVELPTEQFDPWTIMKPTPQGRGQWTPDSSVVYTMASGPAWSGGHSYLYALQVAPIHELEHALAGTAGLPHLTGTGTLEAGKPVTLSLTQALPGAKVLLVAGSTPLGLPIAGGVLLPSPELLQLHTVDTSGALQLTFPWPAGVPAESTLYAQAWIEDPAGPAGWAASNALSLISP